VVALEAPRRDAGAGRDCVQLVEALVADEVAPTPTAPPPERLIDQHGHRRRLARVEEWLRAHWQAAIHDGRPPDAAPPRPAKVEDTLDRLLARHREPHRQYHTATHVAAALATADDLLAEVEGPDGAAVRLALFFHDAVYDPQAAPCANEMASAALAERELAALGVGASCVDAACAAIMATADHVLPPGASPTAAIVLDADLAILAAEPARYDAYATGVRAEYAHVDDAAWRTGRAAVLVAFLDRPTVFVTAPMRSRESRARANLSAELSRLRAGG
jgi:predicted metal-dependent HD superfamily phosphohydrolase